ncbi:MAG: hypothetical protein LAT68_13655 [Cyclobacteriaceae bacterium]|nr:hypothetical protein [Cyclobacteriaceae bacterium]MCH8517365.1 hypothetical protein [Cyclobacteriaceae bacterium]
MTFDSPVVSFYSIVLKPEQEVFFGEIIIFIIASFLIGALIMVALIITHRYFSDRNNAISKQNYSSYSRLIFSFVFASDDKRDSIITDLKEELGSNRDTDSFLSALLATYRLLDGRGKEGLMLLSNLIHFDGIVQKALLSSSYSRKINGLKIAGVLQIESSYDVVKSLLDSSSKRMILEEALMTQLQLRPNKFKQLLENYRGEYSGYLSLRISNFLKSNEQVNHKDLLIITKTKHIGLKILTMKCAYLLKLSSDHFLENLKYTDANLKSQTFLYVKQMQDPSLSIQLLKYYDYQNPSLQLLIMQALTVCNQAELSEFFIYAIEKSNYRDLWLEGMRALKNVNVVQYNLYSKRIYEMNAIRRHLADPLVNN